MTVEVEDRLPDEAREFMRVLYLRHHREMFRILRLMGVSEDLDSEAVVRHRRAHRRTHPGHAGERGTAWGVAAAGGATLDADQLAVLDAFGGAVVTDRLTGSVSLRARNVYARGVQPTRQPDAHDAAGVIVSAGASVELENILVDRSDHGFAVVGYPHGRLSIRRGVFARQRRLGAVLGEEPGVFDTLSLTDVIAVEVGDPYVRNTLD